MHTIITLLQIPKIIAVSVNVDSDPHNRNQKEVRKHCLVNWSTIVSKISLIWTGRGALYPSLWLGFLWNIETTENLRGSICIYWEMIFINCPIIAWRKGVSHPTPSHVGSPSIFIYPLLQVQQKYRITPIIRLLLL